MRCRVKKNKGTNITALALEWTLLSEIVFSTYACNFCRKLWAGDWILKAVLPLTGTATVEALRERERKNKWGNDIWLFVYTMKERDYTKPLCLWLLYFFAHLLPCLKINKQSDKHNEGKHIKYHSFSNAPPMRIPCKHLTCMHACLFFCSLFPSKRILLISQFIIYWT